MPISPQLAARVFTALISVVAAFQLALALGTPWGGFAMGGAYPGALPPPMRVAAIVQIAALALAAAVVLSRAGLVLPAWRPASRPLTWVIVVLLGVSTILNLITPSALERLIWAPVAVVLFLSALRVALSR